METLSELQHKIIVELAKRPLISRPELADRVGRSVSSLNQAVPDLKSGGALKEGLLVDPEWNPLQKYFIFIETKPPARELIETKPPAREPKSNYQRDFVSQIEHYLKTDKFYSIYVFLEDIEIVMGADWDIIMILRSERFVHIARFITEYLRSHPIVSGTRTSQVLLKENPRVKERNSGPEFAD